MKIRSNSGAVLPFIIAATLVIAMIGFCFFVLSLQMGGSRELLHATDAGSLRVAREEIRHTDVALRPQTEEDLNFSALLDRSEKGNQVCLANYNRIVGQTLLVALNASADGSVAGKQHADELVNALEGPNGIGARLRAKLSDKEKMGESFSFLSSMESVRMLGQKAEAHSEDDKYQVAYMEPGASTNVKVIDKILPYSVSNGMTRVGLPAGSTNAETVKLNNVPKTFTYVSGYAPIQIPGLSKTITGVPVMPFKDPHLVSQRDFNDKLQTPKGVGNVPPNSFKCGGAAADMRGIACSIVGARDVQFNAAIPNGYLVIKNGNGNNFDDILSDGDQIFADELDKGIWVGPGSGSNRAFTTDKHLYDLWLAYNKNNALPQPPSNGIFGDPRTITADAVPMTFYDFDGRHPEATAMLPKFVEAYPHANKGQRFLIQDNSLTSVEELKARVMAAFYKVGGRYHDPTFQEFVPIPGPTGMKAFDHGKAYDSPQHYPVNFGSVGSLKQFLRQCGENGTSILQQVEQRIYQIKPEATAAEINEVLEKQCIGMNSNLVIYRTSKAEGDKLCISSLGQAPQRCQYQNPDGTKQTAQSDYHLDNKSVNVLSDANAPVFPFMEHPDPVGKDSCFFTPSSGYRNLLGVMEFQNSTAYADGSSVGRYADPN